MELHPDRNFGNVESATKLFAEVQSAYEVLSDPQERAWYDSHRAAILSSGKAGAGEHYDHNVRVTTTEDILKLFSQFNSSVEFSDSPTGFYGVLRERFANLATEEEMACQWDSQEPVDYPSFGHADDSYESVVRPFYAVWMGFATQKSFSWMDKYRYSDAPDRRVRRMMEKENKRFRDDAIRDFNDAVRSLVAFVRKRDPRFKPNSQSESERQKILRDSAAAQAARMRAANKAKFEAQELPEWARSEEPEEEISDEESESSEEELQYECIVCSKTFKSEKQLDAHEKSKKHVKAIQQLQRQMRKENKNMDLDRDGSQASPARSRSPEAALSEHHPSDVEELADPASNLTLADGDQAEEADEDLGPDVADAKGAAPTEELAAASDSSEVEDDTYAPRESVEKRIVGDDAIESATATLSAPSEQVSEVGTDDAGSSTQKKLGKAKAKRAKKAAQKETADASSSDFTCAACQASFPSKTRLFTHIKDFGHAQPVARPPKTGKSKKR